MTPEPSDLPGAARRRTNFFVSDGTGITAEVLGHSLLTQFDGIAFTQVTVPFVDSVGKAQVCAARISASARGGPARPLVFTTLVNPDVRDVIRGADAFVLDLFELGLGPLEAELGAKSTHRIGRSHSAFDKKEYQHRIEAVNFALAHDDGVGTADLNRADVVLVGVSRSGKTPTSLYLALQFGVRAANCPLVPEDLDRMRLPEGLAPVRRKLYGLTIGPDRLREIRQERRPDSRYASLENCRYEVERAEALMQQEDIRWANTTTKSIEEIASTIMDELELDRRVY